MARPKNRRHQTRPSVTDTPKKEVKPPSSPLYVSTMFGLMLVGVLMILVNYLDVFPVVTYGVPLMTGLALIAGGFLMTMNWH